MTRPVEQLVTLLRNPTKASEISGNQWTDILCVARAELLLATLAERLKGKIVPEAVAQIFADARTECAAIQQKARWEAQCAVTALAPLGIPPILLKGAAYLSSGLDAAKGRHIGDLDILVPRDRLDHVEAALLENGWEWVKEDPYDQAYYRQWMHELPPLIHRDRDGMIDVHHTILPLTAKPRPDAEAMIERADDIGDGLKVLDPHDMLCHCAAHFLADGDMAGGLRNLWDFHLLVSEFCTSERSFGELRERAQSHDLWPAIRGTLRLAHDLYGTAWPQDWGAKWSWREALFRRRLLARNGWGQETHPPLRFAIYIRSHWLRMPPFMLARHLWIKWRKGADAERSI
ncbi:nucleotidyltransferase domain-containing protein [Alterisphingorhabdus coralli]|uniref:Nucleotidyltransferase family protein n=1 Tax=Alterisphingorhabdus coralli TaxID=3071408 RepID=A0AA97F6Y6_9SPHN|nr:nucleotidyltransferase family protein [Parasphingorhabdus sp. SCSIO 66989]WOE74232.1 nucleotidyltransferase family protein [Parasphingorhabdus sp. SCSIO 66989]